MKTLRQGPAFLSHRLSAWAVALALALAALWAWYTPAPARAQTPSPLATPTFSGPYIVVVGNGEYQINVRAGPGVNYPAVGILVLGQKAPALARTRNWVQIVYPGAPEGTGWVFAPLVKVENGLPPQVTPPPTPTPEYIPTPDPTLVAQYELQPTPTVLPTFTPPPSLVLPTFPPPPQTTARFPVAVVILSLTVLGGLGLVVSFLRER